ncbi:protein LNK2-like isoform X1 [Coffea eugenioides]|uniref:Protein LNK2 isoform X3 n=1 Tax=Coffea arabica TaxID=13443 RepID=A0A6P6WK58_COFAR|nr:protein LNK2-like isoform X3 [Coffea arabica]XP_027159577.1 protein LNK2-like isoform X1 [Coffea eugenioides]
MFDWNDEELSNIIWGEAGEGEDHIVPYPDANEEKPLGSYGDCIKKEKNQEAVDVKTAEQKKPATQSDLHGVKLQCSSQYDTNEDLSAMEFGVDSWPDLSLPGAAKANEDTMEDKAAPLDNASEIFQSPLDDSEQGDFVDYGWASVGSFEDLERIFSNEDPIFGCGSLVNADELWSSSKDVTSSPEKSIPMSGDFPCLGLGSLRSTSEQFDVQGEYLSDQNQCFTPGHEKINLLTSNVPQNVKSCAGNIGYTGSSNNISMKEKAAFEMSGSKPVYNLQLDSGNFAVANECMVKGNKRKKLKGWKKSAEKSEGRHLQNLQGWTQTGNQFLQFDAPYAPNMGQSSSSLVFSQQTQFQGSESSHYKHLSSPLLTSFINGTMAKQYTAMPVLSQFHSGEVSQQPAISSYEVPGHLNPSTEPSVKSLTMTPQEKIEKLRRRQQMRAMLAIQKQQQQFGNQMSSTEYSAMEGENIEAEENLSTVASLEPNSPIEQDDSNTACVPHDDCSVQDSILYQLQDIVAKLDMRIRLCIRDSLFRLAQSASQRQNASDTSSSNKSNRDEVLSKEEINTHNRFLKASEAETETNPIDRTVAHLLFHRPLELTGRIVETPEPNLSAKILHYDKQASSSMSLQTNNLPQRLENKQILSHEESEVPCLFRKENQLEKALETSENTLTARAAETGIMKVEPSQ